MTDEMKTWEKRVGQAKDHPPTSIGTFIHFDTILAADAELAALRDRLALAEKVVDNARELTREHFGKFYEPGGCRCNMCASIRAYNAALKEG